MASRSSRQRADGVPPAWRDLLLIVLLLLVVDAVAAWLLVSLYYRARSNELLAGAPRQLSLLAKDRQNALAGWVRERLSDAELAGSLFGDASRNGTAPALLDRFVRTYGYEATFVLDDRGALLLHRGEGTADAASVAAFVAASPDQTGAWIDFRRMASGQPRVLIASRFDGGTVVFVSDPYVYVYPLLTTFAAASKTGETNLIGLYGEWAVALNPYAGDPAPPLTTRRRMSRERMAWALASGERSIRMLDRRNKKVIGVVKAIPRTPWVVFVKIDEAEALAPAADETIRLGQLVAFVSMMLATVAFTILRSRRVRALRAAEDQLARLFANSTAGILVLRVVLDEHGAAVDHEVVDMNPAATELFGVIASEEIGKRPADAPYLQWPAEIRAKNYDVALTGASIHYEQIDAASQRWYEVRCFSPRPGQFAQMITDVSERRRLSARLLRVQDETRRRIARDLHETVAQSRAGLRMNLGMIKGTTTRAEIVDDSIAITDDALTEVRTLSYLLHPPMIDEAGLVTALQWYVDGFQQRSGITTTLDAPDDLGRLPRDVQTAVFRIVQECLTNVQRHSGSTTARVSIERDGDRLSFEIADQGRGLPYVFRANQDALLAAGVGVAGINERVHELRGDLAIESSERGTTVRIMLPVPADLQA